VVLPTLALERLTFMVGEKKVQSEIVLCATFFFKNASLSNAIFVFVYWDRTTNPKTRILRPV